jgi:hypothetical protein
MNKNSWFFRMVWFCMLPLIGSQVQSQDTQSDITNALAYFEEGGAWTFRYTASEVVDTALVLILKPKAVTQTHYTIGAFQFDKAPKDYNVIVTVASVLSDYDKAKAFAERFAKGIDAGRLQAYVISRSPTQDKEPFSLNQARLLKSNEFLAIWK